MSLLHQNRSFSTGDYLFLASGLLGLFAFFMTYGLQDPRSILDRSLDRQSATMKAAEVSNTLGFSSGNYETRVNFAVNERLLDTLQFELGRQELISRFSGPLASDLFPYYWEIRFSREPSVPEEEIIIGEGPESRRINSRGFVIHLDQTGRWIGLDNDLDDDGEFQVLPDQSVNREALRHAFESDSSLSLWGTVPDSAWIRILSFDRERGYADTVSGGTGSGESVKLNPRTVHQYSRDELLRLASWHINRSGWNLDRFEVEEIEVETLRSTTVARIRYTVPEPVYGQDVSLEAAVTPTGALLSLEGIYNRGGSQANDSIPIWQLLTVGAIFLFCVGSVIIFYFRIRARVVDTKSALVISILTGFVVPVVIFLNQAADINLLGEGAGWIDFVGLGINMGVLGALASIGFFVVSAISDSITRQHWPGKLDCYDYLRQGMFFNKPVGEVLVRSVTLSFIVAGIWSLMLWSFPNLYMEVNDPFLTDEVIWPPVYLLLDNIWYSLIIVMGIFMVVGSQVYAQTQNRWIAGASMALATAIIAPLPFSMGPPHLQFLLFLVFGIVLTLIYMKWDFLTLFVTHFFLTCLLVASSGWIAENSPDTYLFVSFVVFLLFVTAGGTLSILMGKEEQALPTYVPEYVEVLAQEERIKQELQIARNVQQSFLPIKTPAINNLDLAAICKPAYETGGDYYDFIQLDDHRVAVAIGDVSGKGIQAAFYMTFTKGILHSLCRETESPAELLKKANKLFFDNARRGTFVSLIYGIVDTRQKTFRFARAGHNPILHIENESGEMELLQPNGLGLGLTIDSLFDDNIQETNLHLNSGDVLVLYTDGIVEAMNSAHQFYGTKRLLELLKQKRSRTSNEILASMVTDVTKFAGQAKQHDDMTVMVIRLKDNKQV